MSKQDYNNVADDLIVATVTSNLDAKPYAVLFTNNDMADGMLKVDSCIRADKVYTLSQNIVIKSLGRVKPEIVEKAKEKLLSVISEPI